MKHLVYSLSGLAVCLLGAWIHGCGPGGSPNIVKEVASLKSRMSSPGSVVWKMGDSIARRIAVLPEGERTDAAGFYMKEVEEIGTAEPPLESLPVWLYNFQGLLKSVDLLHIDERRDGEWVLRQYERCLDCYKKALELYSSRKSVDPHEERKVADVRANLMTDCGIFCEMVRKVYLPLVAARILPQERYTYWRNVLEKKMRELGYEELLVPR